MILHLADNHVEAHTFVNSGLGFIRWFPSFPTRRFLRWPFGRTRVSTFSWVCTRKELMRGMLTEVGDEFANIPTEVQE